MAKPSGRHSPAGVAAAPVRVLVVEDDQEAALLLRELFDPARFAVDVADTAERAVECFRRQTYVVLLADLNLPGSSGLDLIEKLRQAAPDTAVVVMTGHAS